MPIPTGKNAPSYEPVIALKFGGTRFYGGVIGSAVETMAPVICLGLQLPDEAHCLGQQRRALSGVTAPHIGEEL
jgi:hypothetical protein